jgi:hypothetical protein
VIVARVLIEAAAGEQASEVEKLFDATKEHFGRRIPW